MSQNCSCRCAAASLRLIHGSVLSSPRNARDAMLMLGRAGIALSLPLPPMADNVKAQRAACSHHTRECLNGKFVKVGPNPKFVLSLGVTASSASDFSSSAAGDEDDGGYEDDTAKSSASKDVKKKEGDALSLSPVSTSYSQPSATCDQHLTFGF